MMLSSKPNCSCFLLIVLFFLACEVDKKQHERSVFLATDAVEYGLTMNDTGNECYFARSDGKWGQRNTKSTIYRAIKIDGQWGEPKVASFSGVFDDSDPHLSQDGKTLYFISNRPSAQDSISADIWKVERTDNGEWGIPQRLPNPINSSATEYSPRTDEMGNLYFSSDKPDGYGQGDLYWSQKKGEDFAPPKNMGPILNSNTGEWNLEINSRGDLIIFEASGRKENVTSYGDLYISFKKNDIWSNPQNMSALNTSGSDLYPFLDKTETYLYFTSSDSLQSKDTNIYKVDFDKNRYQ